MPYFPTKVRSKAATKAGGKAAARPRRRRGSSAGVKVKFVTQFARQLSTLQDAGLPILRSLRILQEQQKSGSFKRIIGYVGDDIEGGCTLSEAFGKYPRAFDRLFVNMVAAGEAGGVLDLILARIADFKERSEKLKGRVKSAMVYPVVVLSAAFLILLGLMTFVIPQFKTVLEEMVGGDLNKFTQTVLGISQWIAYRYGWAVLLGVPFGLVFAIRMVRQFRPGRHVLDTVNLRLPVMGQLISKTSIARWTRTLGTLISAGVPILARDRRQRGVRQHPGQGAQLHSPGRYVCGSVAAIQNGGLAREQHGGGRRGDG